uniref:nuclear transcription factor Y subunit A-7-like isoform X2 n=1 Tax=Erigeron canadensis TaxID=72917 RepID=UPI001CB98586|nr:nuclear transcription factor Y subunit A-7-like isoform X2 [Erigeron canadensis]
MVYAPNATANATELTRQTHNQDSSMCYSSDQSHKDDNIDTQVLYSQDHYSSDSDESNKKLEETQVRPILFMGNPSFGMTDNQTERNMPVIQHAYADHYMNGFYAGYAPHPMIQPHFIQIAPTRVPLPLDLSEDGPVYVNAKQYNGILRRRQIRAKLDSQNKLVKNRRPYLHESRHKHALNRVRGSGGRFLPTKKTQQSKPSCFLSSHCATTSGSDHVMYSHMDQGYSWGRRGSEGFLSNVDHNHASIGR